MVKAIRMVACRPRFSVVPHRSVRAGDRDPEVTAHGLCKLRHACRPTYRRHSLYLVHRRFFLAEFMPVISQSEVLEKFKFCKRLAKDAAKFWRHFSRIFVLQSRGAKWGWILNGGVSKFVPKYPVLSPFVLSCPSWGPERGQKRTNGDKPGHLGTNRETPPCGIHPPFSSSQFNFQEKWPREISRKSSLFSTATSKVFSIP